MADEKILSGKISCTTAKKDTRVALNDTFSMVVPKGMEFSTDPEEINDDKLLRMFSPVSSLKDEDVMFRYSNAQKAIMIYSKLVRYDGLVIELTDENQRKLYEQVLLDLLNTAFKEVNPESNAESFIIKSDENVVIAASSKPGGMFAFDNANEFFIAFSFGYYTGQYKVYKECDYDNDDFELIPEENAEVYRETITKWLETVEPVVHAASDEPETSPIKVSDISYNDKRSVTVGALTVPVPDGMSFAVNESDVSGADKMPQDYKNDYDFLCIPKDRPQGYANIEESSVSVFLFKPILQLFMDELWKSASLDEITRSLQNIYSTNRNQQALTESLKIVTKKNNFIILSSLYSGSGAKEKLHWRSYSFFIITGNLLTKGMFYFNQEASDEEFESAVNKWLSMIKPTGKAENLSEQLVRAELGPYAGKNGKIDALIVARLFAEDVLFYPQEPLKRTENGIKSIVNFNLVKKDEHPLWQDNGNCLRACLDDLITELDNCADLKLPKSKIHKKLSSALLDDQLTGLTFLNLMAFHMVKIIEKEKNSYLVFLDHNVVAGIPDAYTYTCKFIKFARGYNDVTGGFTVEFVLATVLDSPIDEYELEPVKGASQSPKFASCQYTVSYEGEITGDPSTPGKTTVDTYNKVLKENLGQSQVKSEYGITEGEMFTDYFASDSESKPSDDTIVTIVKIRLSATSRGKIYDYLCDIDNVSVGDKVSVEGKDGFYSVLGVEQKAVKDLSLPFESYKKVLKKQSGQSRKKSESDNAKNKDTPSTKSAQSRAKQNKTATSSPKKKTEVPANKDAEGKKLEKEIKSQYDRITEVTRKVFKDTFGESTWHETVVTAFGISYEVSSYSADQISGKIFSLLGDEMTKLIKDSFVKYKALKRSLSVDESLSIINRILGLYLDTEIFCRRLKLDFNLLNILDYRWNYDATYLKSDLEREKAKLNDERKKIEEQIKAEKAEQRKQKALEREAKEAGITVYELVARRKFTETKNKLSKVKTVTDLLEVADAFEELKDYNDSGSIAEKCRALASEIKERERRAKKEWKSACEKVEEDRKHFTESETAELNRKYENDLLALEEKHKEEMASMEDRLNNLYAELNDLQKSLKSAGLFAFSRKNDLKAKISQNQTEKYTAEKRKESLESRYQTDKEELSRTLRIELEHLPKKCDELYPMPESPAQISPTKEEIRVILKSINHK